MSAQPSQSSPRGTSPTASTGSSTLKASSSTASLGSLSSVNQRPQTVREVLRTMLTATMPGGNMFQVLYNLEVRCWQYFCLYCHTAFMIYWYLHLYLLSICEHVHSCNYTLSPTGYSVRLSKGYTASSEEVAGLCSPILLIGWPCELWQPAIPFTTQSYSGHSVSEPFGLQDYQCLKLNWFI